MAINYSEDLNYTSIRPVIISLKKAIEVIELMFIVTGYAYWIVNLLARYYCFGSIVAPGICE